MSETTKATTSISKARKYISLMLPSVPFNPYLKLAVSIGKYKLTEEGRQLHIAIQKKINELLTLFLEVENNPEKIFTYQRAFEKAFEEIFEEIQKYETQSYVDFIHQLSYEESLRSAQSLYDAEWSDPDRVEAFSETISREIESLQTVAKTWFIEKYFGEQYTHINTKFQEAKNQFDQKRFLDCSNTLSQVSNLVSVLIADLEELKQRFESLRDFVKESKLVEKLSQLSKGHGYFSKAKETAKTRAGELLKVVKNLHSATCIEDAVASVREAGEVVRDNTPPAMEIFKHAIETKSGFGAFSTVKFVGV